LVSKIGLVKRSDSKWLVCRCNYTFIL
jgi:hypothetical protein